MHTALAVALYWTAIALVVVVFLGKCVYEIRDGQIKPESRK